MTFAVFWNVSVVSLVSERTYFEKQFMIILEIYYVVSNITINLVWIHQLIFGGVV
jgi:hypothetical protein